MLLLLPLGGVLPVFCKNPKDRLSVSGYVLIQSSLWVRFIFVVMCTKQIQKKIICILHFLSVQGFLLWKPEWCFACTSLLHPHYWKCLYNMTDLRKSHLILRTTEVERNQFQCYTKEFWTVGCYLLPCLCCDCFFFQLPVCWGSVSSVTLQMFRSVFHFFLHFSSGSSLCCPLLFAKPAYSNFSGNYGSWSQWHTELETSQHCFRQQNC